jgi:FeS assembly SUF system regulator
MRRSARYQKKEDLNGLDSKTPGKSTMIRLSRLTDYGIVLMSQLAAAPERTYNAAEVASGVGLPLPTVSKVMRRLAKRRLLTSHRGAKGGYSLARPPGEISVGEIITALEGPVSLTVCTGGRSPGTCKHEPRCPVQGHWQRINNAIRCALESVTLADMTAPPWQGWHSGLAPRRAGAQAAEVI